MKFVKRPGLASATLLFVGLMAMPVIAQQEVSPDHFDDHPAASHSRKPAAKPNKTAAKPQHSAAAASAQAKSKAVETAVLKADVDKGQASQNPR